MRKFKVNVVPALNCVAELESDFPISINQASEVLSILKMEYDKDQLLDLGKSFYNLKQVDREVFSKNGNFCTFCLQQKDGKYFFKIFTKSVKKEIIEID